MNNNFRENLRTELDFQGILIKELSAQTGIPVASLDCYLGTRATMPSAENAAKIARVLRVSVEYLVFGKDPAVNRQHIAHNRETQEIIRIVENLKSEQRRALLRLLKAFKWSE